MKVIFIKVGDQQLAFPEDIYRELFNNMIILQGADPANSEIIMPDWGRFAITGITVKQLVAAIEEDSTDFWDKLFKGGLPLSFFSIAVNKIVEQRLSYNNRIRNLLQCK